jgi:putative lipoic acid-binding regulatory protein
MVSPSSFSGQLQFPLLWHGRLLTTAPGEMVPTAVVAIYAGLQLSDARISRARSSRSGTYQSWELQATLPDYATMRALFAALEAIPEVKMLL